MQMLCAATTLPCREDCPDPCNGCCRLQSEPTFSAWRWARRFAIFTIVYNAIEAGAAVASGLMAGSIALVGFGLDSVVESASATIIVWRLAHQTADLAANAERERAAVRLIGLTFFGIAIYVVFDATAKLLGRGEPPDRSVMGIALTALSLVIMPVLARLKRRVADQVDSSALRADAAETMLCASLSAVVLIGLLANELAGWWWMDPIAGLVVAAMAIREGREAWQGGELFEAEDGESKPGEIALCSPFCCPACPLVSAWT